MGRGRRHGRYRLGRSEFAATARPLLEAIAAEHGRPFHWADLKTKASDWPALAATIGALREQGLVEYVGADTDAGRANGLLLTPAGREWLALDRAVREVPQPRPRARLSALADG